MFKRALSLFAVLFVACAGNDNDHDNNNNEQLDDECLGVVCGMHAFCAVGPQGIVCVCEQDLQSKMVLPGSLGECPL